MAYTRYYKRGTFFEGQLDNSFDGIDLPFRIKFNFSNLFDHWQQRAESGNEAEAAYAKSILARLDKVPVLRTSFDDVNLIEKHAEEISLLFSPIFPSMTTNNEIKAACMPFHPMFFNLTQRMKNIVDRAGQDLNIVMRMRDKDLIYIYACVFILNSKYQAGFDFFRSLFFDIPDERTKLMRHYIIFFNSENARFIAPEGFDPPGRAQIQELKENFENVELWKKYFPPHAFTFEGFGLATLFDITKEEAVSALKVHLLKRDALTNSATIEVIKNNMISMLNMPDLKVGFATYDKNNAMLQPLGYGMGNSIALTRESAESAMDAFCDMSFARIFKDKNTFIVTSISPGMAEHSAIGKTLVSKGFKSYIAMPLLFDDQIIGILELGSKKECELSAVTANLLRDIAPLFVTALHRSQNEHETQLEAIIQDQCTSIHPAVSWRFFEAAERFLEQSESMEEGKTMEDISFPEVYPLYGQSDIKGSSTERNLAIQADMIEQLTLARKVMAVAVQEATLPIYGQLSHRIKSTINKIKEGLNAGDEITVLEFLKNEIYPVFRHLENIDSKAKKVIQEYNRRIDPELGVIYNKRKDYEETVSLINNKIAIYLDRAQEAAQEMFPHYFERYKTDGVEHNLYIGQSMVKSKTYDTLYLHNLRLWQLMVICEVENMLRRLKPNMKLEMDVTSLILVHHNPITIKFRMEEKRFDVEGAYNIRYEIIKKRIDKAYIKGTPERLTQVGKIAIVYTQDKEAEQYLHYLEYLQSINYIGPDIEWLELNDLQGVTGLKALRVDIVFQKNMGKKLPQKSSEKVRA